MRKRICSRKLMQKKHMHPHTGITDSKPIDGKMKEFYPRSILHNVWSTKGKAREEKHGFNQNKKKKKKVSNMENSSDRRVDTASIFRLSRCWLI